MEDTTKDIRTKIEIYDQYLMRIYQILCICPYRLNLVLKMIDETEDFRLKRELVECYNCSVSEKNIINSESFYRSLSYLFRYYDCKKRKQIKKNLRLKIIG